MAVVAVPVALAALAFGLTRTPHAPPLKVSPLQEPARPAPVFTLEAVREGQPPVTLPSGTPAVVNFFGSWCEPCKKELPALEAASQRWAGKVAFVGIDTADARDNAVALLDRLGITFPTGYDPKAAVTEQYRLRGAPSTAFVSASGRIVDVAPGALDRAEIDRRVRHLLETGVTLRRTGS